MGNFVKDTVGKIAGNVTQSVTSAVIVTLITTYVLVDIGKKGDADKPSAADSLAGQQPPAAAAPQGLEGQVGQPGGGGRGEEGSMLRDAAADYSSPKETLSSASGAQAPVMRASGEADSKPGDPAGPERKRPVPRDPVERKLESTVVDNARARRDSVVKDKKLNEDVKKVQDRADDVFDELDQEEQKPPQ